MASPEHFFRATCGNTELRGDRGYALLRRPSPSYLIFTTHISHSSRCHRLVVLKYKPVPVYIFDEIDPALDPSHAQHISTLIPPWRTVRHRCAQGGLLVVLLEVDRREGWTHCRTAHTIVQRTAQRDNSSLYNPTGREHKGQEGAPGGPRRRWLRPKSVPCMVSWVRIARGLGAHRV